MNKLVSSEQSGQKLIHVKNIKLLFRYHLQTQLTLLAAMLIVAVSAKSVMRKSERTQKQQRDDTSDYDFESSGEIKQMVIEKKVPVFVEKIRHVPVIQKEYISVPRYISKPVYIERAVPFVIPRNYHHHHFSSVHHFHGK